MAGIILPENDYSIVTANEVTAICAPLFKNFGINKFVYGRVFDDHTCCSLITSAEYQKHHFKQGYLLTPPFPVEKLGQRFFYFLSENEAGPYQPILYDFRNLFNFWYPLFSIERYQGYYDLYLFCSPVENYNIINFYLNHLDVLENFKFYFKEKAEKLIKNSYKNKFLIPEHMRPTFGGIGKNTQKLDKSIFIEPFKTRRYKVEYEGKEIAFTKREVESLEYFANGHTVKEAAKLMELSPRTVEKYLNNIKQKLNCGKKSEIIDQIIKFGFVHFFK